MGEVLFLSHRIPFPPDRGDKIRSHHLLQAIAALAPVHVGTFADDEQDHRCEPDLAAISTSHCLLRRRKPLPVAGVEALVSGKPLSLPAFHDHRLARYVRQVLATRDIATIVLFSGQMGQYVPPGFRGRVVSDLVDVDSAKFEAYALRHGGFRGWMERREARLLQREEERIARLSDITLLVSDAEAGLLKSRLSNPGDPALRVLGMGNGLDSVFFDPARVLPEPRMMSASGPRLIFTGQMDYAPNVEAVERAIARIMPRVRQHFPEATLHVVGRNPPASLRACSGRVGIAVWGRVDDIRPWLAAADIALVPLEIARGVQNKVLEAMAMRLPVVLSREAATGIGARDGTDFLVSDGDGAMADAVALLAANPERSRAMGQSAREWIVGHASWAAALAGLPGYLALPAGRLHHAA